MGSVLALIVCLFIGAAFGIAGMVWLALPQGTTCENPSCAGAEDPGRGEFCQHCGDELRPLCPNCSMEIRQGQKYCAECGTFCGEMEEETVEELPFEEDYPTVQMTCFHCGERLYNYTGTCPHCGITDGQQIVPMRDSG